MLGTVPQLHAAGHPAASPALPIEHRIKLDPGRIESALAHVKVFTPSETTPPVLLRDLGILYRQELGLPISTNDTSTGGRAVETGAGQNAPVFRFAIGPGPLTDGIRQFQTITGLTVRVAEDVVRNLTTDGVSGMHTAPQALERLLAGSSLSYRVVDSTTFAVEIRLAFDVVNVTGGLPRVESPKYNAPLSEMPQTIQVIPRALLDEQGATSLTDALRNVPGITIQAGEGGGASNTSGDMFNMRGFSANNSIFVDGVRDDGMLTRDVFNLEQIEVFSGPTGSDVGRTNAAGYINLTTKVPQREASLQAAVSYGDNEQVRTTFDVNQPFSLGERGTFFGEAAVRVNVLWQDSGVPGREYTERASKAIAPSIAFGLTTPTRAVLSSQIMSQDNLADYGLPSAASPVGQLAPNAPLAASPVDQSNYYGSPDYDYDHGRQNHITLRLEHDFTPGVMLRNQTRYNTTTREAVITSIQNPAAYDPATNLVSLSRQANERHNDIFSNQTNLSARVTTGRLQHQLSVGLEIGRERQFAPTLGGVGTRTPVDLHNPDVFSPVVGMNIAPTGALTEGSTDTVAVYAFDAFDVSPRVRVNGGVRVERYDTFSHSVAANGVVTDLVGEDTLVSGKAGIIYQLTGNGNLYAAYGSSITPPGSANFQLNAAPSNQNNPNVEPQESTNCEVGTKWDLAGSRLQLSGAYFWTRNKNVIFVVDAAAVPPIFNQDDGQRVNGVVFGAVGRITPRLDLNLSLQYLDSEIESQNPAIDGNRLALTPEFSGNVWATYRLPYDIRVGGGLRYTDAVFISTANTTAVPRYGLVDALVEAPLGDRLTLRLNLYNLTDRVYIRNINNNAGRYNPGTPRSFLLSSAFRF
jgi:catecholate siderophore receptor